MKYATVDEARKAHFATTAKLYGARPFTKQWESLHRKLGKLEEQIASMEAREAATGPKMPLRERLAMLDATGWAD